MPDLPEAIKKGSRRLFLQQGGSFPENLPRYHGKDTQYIALTGAQRPIRGGYEPLRVNDPDNLSQWANVAYKESPPDLPTATLEVRPRRGALPFSLSDLICPNTIYVASGDCASVSNFDYGWKDFLEVWSNGRAMGQDGGDRAPFEDDDLLQDGIEHTFIANYGVGSIMLADPDPTGVTLELKDATFWNKRTCADCGPGDDGSRYRYILQIGGVASKPSVRYSNDFGVTWTAVTIDAAANAEEPTTVRIIGNYCVVSSPTAQAATQGGYYYVAVNQATGAPGSAWTKVTSGFANNQEPRDMFALSEREIFFACDSGYILKVPGVGEGATAVESGSLTTNALLRIHGLGDVLMVGAASGKVLYSTNRGYSWALTAADPDTTNVQALTVRGARLWWVGTSDGQFYYSRDQGATWVEKTIPGVTPSAINEIVFPTLEMGFLAAVVGGVGKLYSTCNAGNSWIAAGNDSPRLVNQPSGAQRYNRIAVPSTSRHVAANTLLAVGLGAVTDGMISQGTAHII